MFVHKLLRMLGVVGREATAALRRGWQPAECEQHAQGSRETATAFPSTTAAAVSRLGASFIFLLPWVSPTASAPVKAIEQLGESPDRGIRYRLVVDGNCVFNRKGGEQPKTKEQSVTKVNSIQPSLSGSVLVTREPLTSWIDPLMTAWSVG